MNLSELSDSDLLAHYKYTEQKIAEFHNTQMALKILLNGGYGAMSNEFNRWYSDDIAESITLSGQLSARWIIQHLNRYFNNLYKTEDVDYIVATDTDSVHINFEPAIKRAFGDRQPDHEEMMTFATNFAGKIDKVIQEGYAELSHELNVFEAAMHMKLEAISRAVWTGKKHYAMEIWSGENGIRYNPAKLKLVGLEAVKSSTPAQSRKWMKELIPLILNGNIGEIKGFIEQKREEYVKLPFDAIAYPRGITELDKYTDSSTVYAKGCPIHVRSALVYNDLVKKSGMVDRLPLIQGGDKIRFAYMVLPNPVHENIFACPDTLPAEFGLEPYIDFATQFNKSFYEPMAVIVEARGLKMSDEIDIDQFF